MGSATYTNAGSSGRRQFPVCDFRLFVLASGSKFVKPHEQVVHVENNRHSRIIPTERPVHCEGGRLPSKLFVSLLMQGFERSHCEPGRGGAPAVLVPGDGASALLTPHRRAARDQLRRPGSRDGDATETDQGPATQGT